MKGQSRTPRRRRLGRHACSARYGAVRTWVVTARPYRKCRCRCGSFRESAVVENVGSPSKEVFQIRHRRIIHFEHCGEELWMFVVPHDWRAYLWLDFDAVELPLTRCNQMREPSVWGFCATAAATRPHVAI